MTIIKTEKYVCITSTNFPRCARCYLLEFFRKMNGAHERGLRMFVSANVREGQILFVSVFGLRVSDKLQNVECQTFKMLLIHWERKLKIRYPPPSVSKVRWRPSMEY